MRKLAEAGLKQTLLGVRALDFESAVKLVDRRIPERGTPEREIYVRELTSYLKSTLEGFVPDPETL